LPLRSPTIPCLRTHIVHRRSRGWFTPFFTSGLPWFPVSARSRFTPDIRLPRFTGHTAPPRLLVAALRRFWTRAIAAYRMVWWPIHSLRYAFCYGSHVRCGSGCGRYSYAPRLDTPRLRTHRTPLTLLARVYLPRCSVPARTTCGFALPSRSLHTPPCHLDRFHNRADAPRRTHCGSYSTFLWLHTHVHRTAFHALHGSSFSPLHYTAVFRFRATCLQVRVLHARLFCMDALFLRLFSFTRFVPAFAFAVRVFAHRFRTHVWFTFGSCRTHRAFTAWDTLVRTGLVSGLYLDGFILHCCCTRRSYGYPTHAFGSTSLHGYGLHFHYVTPHHFASILPTPIPTFTRFRTHFHHRLPLPVATFSRLHTDSWTILLSSRLPFLLFCGHLPVLPSFRYIRRLRFTHHPHTPFYVCRLHTGYHSFTTPLRTHTSPTRVLLDSPRFTHCHTTHYHYTHALPFSHRYLPIWFQFYTDHYTFGPGFLPRFAHTRIYHHRTPPHTHMDSHVYLFARHTCDIRSHAHAILDVTFTYFFSFCLTRRGCTRTARLLDARWLLLLNSLRFFQVQRCLRSPARAHWTLPFTRSPGCLRFSHRLHAAYTPVRLYGCPLKRMNLFRATAHAHSFTFGLRTHRTRSFTFTPRSFRTAAHFSRLRFTGAVYWFLFTFADAVHCAFLLYTKLCHALCSMDFTTARTRVCAHWVYSRLHFTHAQELCCACALYYRFHFPHARGCGSCCCAPGLHQFVGRTGHSLPADHIHTRCMVTALFARTFPAFAHIRDGLPRTLASLAVTGFRRMRTARPHALCRAFAASAGFFRWTRSRHYRTSFTHRCRLAVYSERTHHPMHTQFVSHTALFSPPAPRTRIGFLPPFLPAFPISGYAHGFTAVTFCLFGTFAFSGTFSHLHYAWLVHLLCYTAPLSCCVPLHTLNTFVWTLRFCRRCAITPRTGRLRSLGFARFVQFAFTPPRILAHLHAWFVRWFVHCALPSAHHTPRCHAFTFSALLLSALLRLPRSAPRCRLDSHIQVTCVCGLGCTHSTMHAATFTATACGYGFLPACCLPRTLFAHAALTTPHLYALYHTHVFRRFGSPRFGYFGLPLSPHYVAFLRSTPLRTRLRG